MVYCKLIYKDKLTEEEKNYLALFTGERVSDKLIATAFDIRRTSKKNQNNHWNEEQESMKDFMQKLENDRKSLVQVIEEYGAMINADEVTRDLIQSICFSPFTPRNASQN